MNHEPTRPDLVLETPRLRLRHVHELDIPSIYEAAQTPGFTDGMMWSPPASLEELREPHERAAAAWREGSCYTFSFDRKDDGIFAGRIVIADPQSHVWRIGFWTMPKHQGQGYATEAAARVLQFGFETLGASRITAMHCVWNHASERVLTKIGMRLIRHVPEGLFKNGHWSAENELGITAEEWRERTGG